MCIRDRFSVDALVAPPRVVACEREDEVSDLGIDEGTARVAVRVGPMPGDEATMPTQQRRRCHDQRSPTTPVQNLAGGSEEATIRRLQLETADPTTKNLDLMAQHHKFQVLRALRPAPQHQQSKDAPQRQVDERPDQFPPPELGGETLRRQRRATDMPRTTRIRFPHPTRCGRVNGESPRAPEGPLAQRTRLLGPTPTERHAAGPSEARQNRCVLKRSSQRRWRTLE